MNRYDYFSRGVAKGTGIVSVIGTIVMIYFGLYVAAFLWAMAVIITLFPVWNYDRVERRLMKPTYWRSKITGVYRVSPVGNYDDAWQQVSKEEYDQKRDQAEEDILKVITHDSKYSSLSENGQKPPTDSP